jgi:hypothetical protein
VGPEGRAVLTDFGSGTWKGAPPLTEWVVPPNTREYRSPESLRFEWTHWRKHGSLYETRPADDLYALGVAAYRLVTGVYPPPGTDPETLKAQFQIPLPPRRPVHELNRRVVPELSALIERMLAKEPEARGTAREIAEAAEAAAKHERPEANVPLLGHEGPEAKVQAVPIRDVPPSGSKLPRAAIKAVPAHERTEHQAPFGESRFKAFALVGAWVLLLTIIVWRGPAPPAALPSMTQVEAPEVESAPDGGTRGLGDDAVTTRVEAPTSPITLEAVSQKIPERPLPDQRRPPCQYSWEVEINGGCWRHIAGSKPPCAEGDYEWQGTCYDPARIRKRVPTSEEQQ